MQVSDVKTHLLKPFKVEFPDYHEIMGASRAESYVVDLALIRAFTDEGNEGNFTVHGHDLARSLHEPLKMIVGTDPLKKEKFLSQFLQTRRRGFGTGPYWSWPTWTGGLFLCVVDVCMWDIIGKSLKLPIYKLLGECREKVMAYASTHHLKTVKEYVATAAKCLDEGFKAIKIHPPSPLGFGNWRRDLEVCRAVRDAVGDDIALLLDPYSFYSRRRALTVGREIQRLGFKVYEDPLPTSDLDGYQELCRELDVDIWCGEFIPSLYHYSEYIRRRATDAVRVSMENVGGITPLMKVAHLAEAFGMNCEPHSWGDSFTKAAHLQCELAMYNNDFFEISIPQGIFDLPAFKGDIRVESDGYVRAPKKLGLGLEIDEDELNELTIEILN